MNDSIEKSIKFLSDQYDKNVSYINNKGAKDYRVEHSIRVANIGIEIAKKENLDVEVLVLGCILHDVSYMNEFKSEDDWLDHGRNAAIIARTYFESLGLHKEKIDSELNLIKGWKFNLEIVMK